MEMSAIFCEVFCIRDVLASVSTQTTSGAELAKQIAAETYHAHCGDEGYDTRPFIINSGVLTGLTGYLGFADGRPDEPFETCEGDLQESVEAQLSAMPIGACLVLPQYSGCHYLKQDEVYVKLPDLFLRLSGVYEANHNRLFGDRFFAETTTSKELLIASVNRPEQANLAHFPFAVTPDDYVKMLTSVSRVGTLVDVKFVNYPNTLASLLW